LRAQGNRAGRGRCRTDGSPRPVRFPRGLIVSTGEDVPRGQSLRSRLFNVEISPGDVKTARLTACQRDAAAGLYAQALAGFVRWLAPRYADLRIRLRQEAADLRDRARAEGQHARTPGIVADLTLGLKYFLDFAVEAGAVTPAERGDLARRCRAALGEGADAQARHVEAAEPCGHFLRLLAGAVASGRAHVAGPGGAAPRDPEAWGWRGNASRNSEGPQAEAGWAAQGRRIGWLDGDGLFLQPDAAFAEAQEMARHQGDSLAVQPRTLWTRLRERGLLAGWQPARQRNTVRRTLEGVKDRDVLHLAADALSTCIRPSEPSATPPGRQETGEKQTVPADGPADGNGACGADRPPGPSAKLAENRVGGRFGRSGTGGDAEGDDEKNPPGNGDAGDGGYVARGYEDFDTPFDAP
jgi:hypothetical protein